MRLSDCRITSGVALAALSLWVGGLVTLGAVVAPIVFSAVPHGVAADAMTAVFGRFDQIAMSCAAIVLATEAVRGSQAGPVTRADWARRAVTVVLVGLAATDGAWLTPEITRLHAEGAVRGVAEAGMKLVSLHGTAEALGKLQAVLALALIGLHMATFAKPVPEPNETEASA
jgi:Domain of unknown function (DUF4149)